MPDVKQMISAVAAENGIRIELGDPLFALVTMNRMVLEESAQMFHDHTEKLFTAFELDVQKAEKRAGIMLAQMVRASEQEMRQGLQNDIRVAGLQSLEYVHAVNEAHKRPAIIRWAAAGLIAGAALFAAGVWFAPCFH
jgi:redox-regulated HSP33 family molecular chaperone